MAAGKIITNLNASIGSTAAKERLSALSKHVKDIPEFTNMQKQRRAILGLMTFGPPGSEASGARITCLEEFNACLDLFQSQGLSEIDTARIYVNGKQEAFTRSANWKRRGLQIATKVYPREPRTHTAEKIAESLSASLKDLGTDTVDIFYLHAPDRTVPFEETMAAVDALHKAGKFRRLGLSNYASWEVAELWNIANEKNLVKPTVYQAMYNAITRDIETELVPCCRKYGIEIIAYNPVSHRSPNLVHLRSQLTIMNPFQVSGRYLLWKIQIL